LTVLYVTNYTLESLYKAFEQVKTYLLRREQRVAKKYLHIADSWCEGSKNDRLILKLHPALTDRQKETFSNRIRDENSDEVICACWRNDREVRITLRYQNCNEARIDLPGIADELIKTLFSEESSS
jgi:hypothetical protein